MSDYFNEISSLYESLVGRRGLDPQHAWITFQSELRGFIQDDRVADEFIEGLKKRFPGNEAESLNDPNRRYVAYRFGWIEQNQLEWLQSETQWYSPDYTTWLGEFLDQRWQLGWETAYSAQQKIDSFGHTLKFAWLSLDPLLLDSVLSALQIPGESYEQHIEDYLATHWAEWDKSPAEQRRAWLWQSVSPRSMNDSGISNPGPVAQKSRCGETAEGVEEPTPERDGTKQELPDVARLRHELEQLDDEIVSENQDLKEILKSRRRELLALVLLEAAEPEEGIL
ncbi:hypothetical protein SSP24_83820 [Streptomyces spinoverrucosus]|uniref:Uncharacterized protein n=1 Tax=Streptomyces spinoverrucosus TaxID=284043 RepID=A0A4Y3VV27_9ACTN|nr:hypothetical protein [Streptomyces spinoverrucosus]GEC10727.1 hypothetical protein SSP24_83820 [Streptomyces spinoverrucosus]GHB99814.1 hypothetical protein GCM10010397_84920 [Streptomyces spinoverrucosus]